MNPLSENLEEQGYKFNNKGLFCPLKEDYYLNISKSNEKYNYSIVRYENDNIEFLTTKYGSTIPITEENSRLNNNMKEKWKEIGNETDIEPLIKKISTTLLNNPINFRKKKKEKRNTSKDYSQIIKKRRNPQMGLLKVEVKKVEKKIKKYGLVDYLNFHFKKIHKGSHKNLIIKILGAFKIMRGEGSYIFETVAEKEQGKSYEDEIVFDKIIPSRYTYKVNSITKSSFTRYAEKDENYFDRLILIFGDYGGSDSLEEMEELLNIFKVLITEKQYVRDLSERNEDGEFDNKKLKLKVDSIGGVYSTVHNSFTNGDGQLESRTISFTPADVTDDEVMDYIGNTECEYTTESRETLEAEKEFGKFRLYLLALVNEPLEIINPYNDIFKRYAKKSNSPRREYKKIRSLFDSYCKLTYFKCDEFKGKLVASEEQVKEFMQDIYFENALIPYENDFLKMLMAEGKKTRLTIIDADNDENTLNNYYDNVIEELPSELKIKTIYDINSEDEEKFVKKLLELYGLNGTSSNHEKNVFFRITDIRRTYKNLKAYKNIEDVPKLIYNLVNKGYINSTGYKSKKQNIYYLTRECNNISLAFELGEQDKKSAEEFLNKLEL